MITIKDLASISHAFYRPLQEADEIRLLRLHPRSSNGDVTCTLVHTKLSDEPDYEALSYEWGPKKSKDLQIDQARFSARENLWHALCHLAPTDGLRVLWIDAICINQEDDAEKGHQVRQMGKIYSRATTVLVWLGMSDATTTSLFKLISNKDTWAQWAHLLTVPVGRPDQDLYALLSLFRRRYWTRLWIVQEITLARQIVIHCGQDYCTWSNLSLFCKFLVLDSPLSDRIKSRDFGVDSPPPEGFALEAIHNTAAWQYFGMHNTIFRAGNHGTADILPLLLLFEKFSDADCYDPRDKLFGLTSLTMSCCKDAIPIDYSLCWEDIYDTALEHHIVHHNFSGLSPDTNEMVSNTQRLQKTFGLTSKHCQNTSLSFEHIQTVTRELHSDLGDYITLNGSLRGRLVYTTTSISRQDPHTDSPGYSSLPFLTSMIEIEMKHIFMSLMNSKKRNTSSVTSEFDNVQSFSNNRSSCSGIGGTGPGEPPKDYCFIQNEKRSHPPSVTELQRFEEIAKKGQAAIPEQLRSKCQLAVEENGLFCFVPPETRVGDIICQFQNSNILCVIREKPSENTYQTNFHLVGRATSYLPAPTSAFFNVCGEMQDTASKLQEYLSSRLYDVRIYADLTTFYMLTSASATPDGDGEVPAVTALIETESDSAVPPKLPRTVWRRLISLMQSR